eukprot:4314071-Lingulodinium_polyedra.AAC.1
MNRASLRIPNANVTYRWHPEASLNLRVTDIIYRCPMCAASMESRGWTTDQISGWFTAQPTTHFDAWQRDVAAGRRACMIAIRK